MDEKVLSGLRPSEPLVALLGGGGTTGGFSSLFHRILSLSQTPDHLQSFPMDYLHVRFCSAVLDCDFTPYLFAYASENALEWAVTVWCIFRGSKVKLHFKIEHANET